MTLLLLVLLPAALVAEGEGEVRFEMEFSKAEVYAGEPVTVNFVLYARDEVVDVEVAKFPEFRGYWSENLALRQGPMPLVQDFLNPGWRKAVVGSYLIATMLDDPQPAIRPMKVVVRRPQVPGSDGGERVYLSQGPALRVKPLPPFGGGPQDKFSGAVGRFTFNIERTPIFFRRGEPTQMRFILTGEGNFREVNEVPLPPLPEMTVLSSRTYAQGSAQYYTKSFDLTVSLDTDGNVSLPAFRFHYFDPGLGAYQSIAVNEIPFSFTPDVPGLGNGLDAPLELGLPSPHPTPYRAWRRDPLFLLVQAILALAFLGWAGGVFGWREWLMRLGPRSRPDPWSPRLAAARDALQGGRVDDFLGQADALAFDVLARRLALPKAPRTRTELLRQGSGTLKEETLSRARTLFDSWQRRAYSPQKPLPPDPQGLLTALQSLVRDAA